MDTCRNLFVKTLFLASIAGAASYFLIPCIPAKILADILVATGATMSITGTLLGFAVSWLGQSKAILKEIDYDRAEELFKDLASIQRGLILRWGLIITCSIAVVILSVILKNIAPSGNDLPLGFRILASVAMSFLATGFVFVAVIFSSMLAVHDLKSKLDIYERDELRKKRNAE
jgi:hypothetical protein